MAQEFAKAFYNSRTWKDVRRFILKRDCWMCQAEGCNQPASEVHHIIELTPQNINDPNVTVNPDNLIALCGNCHKAITKANKAGRRKKRMMQPDVLVRITFDENGYPVPIPPGRGTKYTSGGNRWDGPASN